MAINLTSPKPLDLLQPFGIGGGDSSFSLSGLRPEAPLAGTSGSPAGALGALVASRPGSLDPAVAQIPFSEVNSTFKLAYDDVAGQSANTIGKIGWDLNKAFHTRVTTLKEYAGAKLSGKPIPDDVAEDVKKLPPTVLASYLDLYKASQIPGAYSAEKPQTVGQADGYVRKFDDALNAFSATAASAGAQIRTEGWAGDMKDYETALASGPRR